MLFVEVGNCDQAPINNDGSSATTPTTTPMSTPMPTPTPTLTSMPTSTPGPSSTSSSLSSCTASQTTRVCQVTCTLSSMADGGMTNDCYATMCSNTVESCGIPGVTTSTTILSPTGMQCPTFVNDVAHMEQICGPGESGGSSCYDEVVLFHSPHKEWRGRLTRRFDPDDVSLPPAPTITNTNSFIEEFGWQSSDMCVLQTVVGTSTKITWPWHLGGNGVMNYDLSTAGVTISSIGTQYMKGTRTNMVRWLSHTSNAANCCPSVTLIAGHQFDANYKTASAASVDGYAMQRPTVDHSFEKIWIDGFFSYIIEPQAPLLASLSQGQVVNNINCEDLHNFFLVLHGTEPECRTSIMRCLVFSIGYRLSGCQVG